MGLFQTKDRHEFKPLLIEIEDRPLNPLGRTLLWIIITFMVLGSLWLFLAKIDIVVSARGKIIPLGEVKVIQPIETGVISKLHVKEGDYVSKGQVLVEIDPSVTETDLYSKQKNLELLEIEISRLICLIENKKFIVQDKFTDSDVLETQKLIYTTTKQSYEQQLELIKKQISQVQEQMKSANVDKDRLVQHRNNVRENELRLLEVIDIIARSEYDTAHKEVVEYEEQVRMKEHEIVQLQEKLNEFSEQELLVKQEYKNKLLEELTQKRKEATLLKVDIKSIKFKNEKQKLTSPVDGYVGKLMVHTVGGIVTPAEKIISIIPKNVPYVIKATVLNQDIGFIKEGMESAVKVDTFSFQKYGLISATVTHIADDAIEDEKLGAVYEIYLEPKKDFLIVDGEKVFLNSGMSVTSELKVGKRRVIEFFIYPLIKYLDEGMSVR
ncbi:HlyD family type I secretion periplasmic adaptor subunit [Sulfurimonas sp.]|uniref:HlyD family type I secretion periplasmic adaptor subunit n=1 Tax=Sulfurimonas sp. TaxID=2022749 RepID=UPI00356957D1